MSCLATHVWLQSRIGFHKHLYRTIQFITALFKHISTHGRPSMVHADLETQFTAQIFRDFNTKYGIRLTHSSPAHPQPTQSLSALINP